MVPSLWKTAGLLLTKLNIALPYVADTAVRFLGIYLPKGFENLCPHKSSFIYNAKFWKQPRCSPVGEWINKLVHSDSGILFSGKEKRVINP